MKFQRWLFFSLVAPLTAAPVRADSSHDAPTQNGSGISIRVATPLKFAPHFGFMPVRVTVENKSSREGVWRIHLNSGDAATFPGLVRAGYEMAVRANSTNESWFFAPLASPGIVATPIFDRAAQRITAALPRVSPDDAPSEQGGAAGAAGAAMEAAAAAILKPTRLLETTWGVRQVISTANGVVIFEQTGAASALPKAGRGSLPPGVIVNLHPALDPGDVVRTVSYVAPETLAALDTPATSTQDAYRKSVSKNVLALTRYGYLRRNAVVQSSAPRSFADSDGVVTTTATETGPAPLMTQPIPEALPPNTLVNVVPAQVLPGGVIRKFTVTTLVPEASRDPQNAEPFSAVVGAAEPGLIIAEISGPGVDGTVRMDLSSGLDVEIQPMPPVAVLPEQEKDLRGRLALGNLRALPVVMPIDPAQLPADWRVWSSLHCVVLTATNFARLDADHRTALRRWAALGGRLVLTTDDENGGGEERIGAGGLSLLPGELGYIGPKKVGEALRLTSPALSLPTREALERDNGSIASFGAGERADSRWVIYVLIGFAVVAGPLNLALFAPSKRRHRIIFTMPLIAVAGAAVLGAGVVRRVGLGGEGARTSIVALLPEEGGAAIFQDQVSRTGLLSLFDFALPDDVILAVAPLDSGGAQPDETVLARAGGEASGNWFRNRAYQAYHLRRFVPAQGGVQVDSPTAGGAPVALSTWAARLTDFAWIDGQERIWTAAVLEPGKKTALTLQSDNKNWPRLTPRASKALDQIFAAVSTREAGRWVARGGETALAPIPTLTSITWNNEVFVTGKTPAKSQGTP